MLLAALLATPGAALAGILIDLDFTAANAAPGQTITFSGTLENLDDVFPVFLNGCTVNVTGSSVVGNCDDYFLFNAPFSLNPSEFVPSFAMFTFTATAPYLDAFGPQSGSFDVLGGPGASDMEILGTANFSVNVTAEAVPEPATGLLGAAVCLVLMAARRRYRSVATGRS
jgi:hypothetical protein